MTRPFRLALALVAFAAAPAAVRADVPLPTGGALQSVDFERHVMGLLSKTGCNSGGCHGSFQGKNGFRLSLFGYDPAVDHAALTRENLGRRVDLVSPDDSLLLKKATGATSHDGGMRFGKESWAYAVTREWVRGGAKWTPGSGTITKLTVTPADFAVVPPGKALQLKVTAAFADGSSEDVTPFCDFKAADDAVAAVTPLGNVSANRPGDTGLSVVYRGSVQALRVLVPAPPLAGGYPKVAEVNAVDREVFAKLRLLNMVPSPVSPDEAFLRRLTIDTIAQLPTPEEVRAFAADASPDKRAKAVDRLLAHPLHAAVWATKLSDITGNNTDALEQPQQLKPRRSQQWHEWLRKRVAENAPYDKTVRDILTATSLDGQTGEAWLAETLKLDGQLEKGGPTDYPSRKTLDLFWRKQATTPPEVWGEKVAAAFLGVRLECAQCHKHPTDRWTQDDYWGFANLFSPVATGAGSTPELRKLIQAEVLARREKAGDAKKNQVNPIREMVFATAAGNGKVPAAKPIPMTTRVVEPKALGGPALPHKAGVDTRAALADWMTDAKNPLFAKSFVNRVWAHYFGVGLVNPVDDFSLANPPTNPRLLDALAAEFVGSGYDLRKLERLVLVSRTYQSSYDDNASNKFDTNNFSRAYVRPLMAEQVVDVLNAALGVDEKFVGPEAMPAGTKMVEVGASRLQNANLAFALRIFGRPPRTTACDCERASEPALPQSLFRMTDPAVLAKFNDPTGRAVTLAKGGKPDADVVEEAFLATLTRKPTAAESAEAVKHLAGTTGKARIDGVVDLFWALINTREFILNH